VKFPGATRPHPKNKERDDSHHLLEHSQITTSRLIGEFANPYRNFSTCRPYLFLFPPTNPREEPKKTLKFFQPHPDELIGRKRQHPTFFLFQHRLIHTEVLGSAAYDLFEQPRTRRRNGNFNCVYTGRNNRRDRRTQ